MIKGRESARIAAALVTAGAKWTPIYRQPLDSNDVPIGDPTRIGCILGIHYRKGMTSMLRIDVPGIVLRDIERFEGVLAAGCEVIEARDMVCIQGETRRIASVEHASGRVYVLTLE